MIDTPIIHDRHLVKQAFNQVIKHGNYKDAFSKPDNLTIVTVRNEGTMEDRIIPSLKGYEDKSILEANLEYLGIQPLVILTDPRLPWRNTFKFEIILNRYKFLIIILIFIVNLINLFIFEYERNFLIKQSRAK